MEATDGVLRSGEIRILATGEQRKLTAIMRHAETLGTETRKISDRRLSSDST